MAYDNSQNEGGHNDLAERALRRAERWLSGEEDAFQAAMDGEPLEKSLSILIRTALEEVDNDRRCAFFIANAARTELRHVVGMPESYARQVDGFKIGLDSLACGLAAATGQPVITPDIDKEPQWEPCLQLARDHDFRACWSFPVETSAGKIVGTFGMYFREPHAPTPSDFRLIASLTHSASIIISHHQQAEQRAEAVAALAAQHILAESEERFRNLANCAPVMLWMTGPDKHCRFVNHGWQEFVGRTMNQEVGYGWSEAIHPADRERYLNAWSAAVDARQPFKAECRFRRHDGEYRWCECAATPRFAPDGEFLGHVGSSSDITDRKQAEEFERHLADLQRLATIGELTAAIAHEIRQPLAAIKLNALTGQKLLLAAPPSSESLRDIYSDILADDERADDILTRIRDFTLMRAAERAPLNVTSVIEETIRLVAVDAQKRRIRIDADLDPSLPLITGDRTQLRQVLMNLIMNAMDAMQSAPPSLRHITVEARRVGDDVNVAVMDQGHGIEEVHQSRLFESFFTTKSDGMGLGLAIAKSIIERHGGRIWAEGNAARGATFRFMLPITSISTPARDHN
jgi:PAS domain S-box-containing protein